MSLTVPFRPRSHSPGDDAGDLAPAPSRRAVGEFELRSVAAYLLVWTGVVFVVEVLVLWSAHLVLDRTGVLGSVSRAVATVLDDEVPATGVLPVLELSSLLPWLLVGAALLAVLWLLTLLAVVVVHNAVCALTGGPRLRVHDVD